MKNIYKTLSYVYIFAGCTLLTGCAHSVKVKSTSNYQPLSYDEKVYVYELEDVVPEPFEVLGQIRIGDTGFSTKCGYDKALKLAEEESRKLGGNAVKVVDHVSPNIGSTCHRIAAFALKIDTLNSVIPFADTYDLITFEDGTTVKCEILASDDQFVYFAFLKNGIIKNGIIKKTSINSIEKNIKKINP